MAQLQAQKVRLRPLDSLCGLAANCLYRRKRRTQCTNTTTCSRASSFRRSPPASRPRPMRSAPLWWAYWPTRTSPSWEPRYQSQFIFFIVIHVLSCDGCCRSSDAVPFAHGAGSQRGRQVATLAPEAQRPPRRHSGERPAQRSAHADRGLRHDERPVARDRPGLDHRDQEAQPAHRRHPPRVPSHTEHGRYRGRTLPARCSARRHQCADLV